METTTPIVTPPSTPTPMSSQPNSSNRGQLFRRIFLMVVILLGLLTIGAVVYDKFFKSDIKKDPDTLVTNDVEVAITKEGFSPASITVAPGTQITWTNTDTKPHQVAADPYPKNDSIPNFDSTIVLQQGESYGFTFEQVGTYTYHDELNAMTLKGSIIVE